MTGGEKRVNPILARKSLSRSSALRPDRSRRRNAISPFSLLTCRVTACRSTARSSSTQRTSCQVFTGASATATTVSPETTWACAAGEPAGGVPSVGLRPGTPCMNSSQYTAIASRKLATGPASTIAKRRHTDCRLKARCRSPAATSPSRSSSIFT
jgi:hypothetical protein